MQAKDYIAFALIAIMMLSPLAAAVFTADNPELQHKARTDLIQSDPAKPPAGAPVTPGGPTRWA